jgi:hypothetical protein
MKGLVSLFLLAALLACTTSSCGPGRTPTPRRSFTTQDPWYTGLPSEGPLYWTWPELDPGRIQEVVESKQPEAERLLEDVPILELGDEQAAEFVGGALAGAPGTRPYLTRGLYLNRQTYMFTVYVREDQLVVYHGTLGTSPLPMRRQALVLQLERKPSEVFVTCTMDE